MNRRDFLRNGTVALGTLAFTRMVARGELAAAGHAHMIASAANGAYGPLAPRKASNSEEVLLALPEGFEYIAIGRAGDAMSDGRATPQRHDGMAAFNVNGKIRLVRNHEINNRLAKEGVAISDSKSYDSLAGGGTTTLIIDPKTRRVIKDFVSLSGTLQNCAGGPTPWGSWITCEETVLGKRRFTDSQGRELGGFSEPHGYCFEVPAKSDTIVTPVPLKAMGRFVHEAIAVDPRTGIVYETEDYGTAGFYRFIPKKRGSLREGGRLQMLAIKGRSDYDTRTAQKTGAMLPVAWVDIDDPDPAAADTDPLAVFKQGKAKGGATFARLEGCWYGGGSVFFTATSGGDKLLGQVWEYRPEKNSDGHIRLFFESPAVEVLDRPDNICVTPRGGLIICEDGSNEQFLRGLTPDGRIFDFAKNMVPGFERVELAGATFSPDGETLFVNIQTPGITFAIWGPWRKGAL
ncbi:MAG TPA: alkaline phosphatase PhoX [Blastocatellia bacterium]|jgi:secreted PhoX family phosphatase